MIYSLDMYIISNNDGIRNAVKNLLPGKTDPRVWLSRPEDYTVREGINGAGNAYLSATVRYSDVTERDGALASIKGIGGVIKQCLEGSYIGVHLCGHDEDIKCKDTDIIREYA